MSLQAHSLKRNIAQFSGFVWGDNEVVIFMVTDLFYVLVSAGIDGLSNVLNYSVLIRHHYILNIFLAGEAEGKSEGET